MIKLLIKEKGISQNKVLYKHWTIAKKIKDAIQRATSLAWLEAKKPKIKDEEYPVSVTINFFFSDGRRRDITDMYTKPIIDALVKMEALEDDDISHVSSITVRGENKSGGDWLTVWINPIDLNVKT